MRGLHRQVALLAALCLGLSGCGTTIGTEPALPPPSQTALPSPTDGSATAATGVAEPSVTATPSPTPSSTALPLQAADLTGALPTNRMLTEVQGKRFKENLRWADHYGEGPEWVADAPLTPEQRRQVLIGRLTEVKPTRCDAVAAFFAAGWLDQISGDDLFMAVAYTKKANSYRFWRDGNIFSWTTIAYLMPVGSARGWAARLTDTFAGCQRYVVIQENGDVRKVDIAKRFKKSKVRFLQSGAALNFIARTTSENGSTYSVQVWEPIGDVLYVSSISILSTKASQWSRASQLYNDLADRLAKVQGITREPVDLIGGTPLTEP